MPCRVGITTNPDRRRREWENEVVGFTGWGILGTYPTIEEAQARKDKYARKTGCIRGAGGPVATSPSPWYVYRFDYIKTQR